MNTEQWIPICWFISIYLEAGQLYEAATKSAKNGSYSSASVASVFALEALGNFLERQGRIDEAAKTYDRAIQEATGGSYSAAGVALSRARNVKGAFLDRQARGEKPPIVVPGNFAARAFYVDDDS